jgi:hypothetical protein
VLVLGYWGNFSAGREVNSVYLQNGTAALATMSDTEEPPAVEEPAPLDEAAVEEEQTGFSDGEEETEATGFSDGEDKDELAATAVEELPPAITPAASKKTSMVPKRDPVLPINTNDLAELEELTDELLCTCLADRFGADIIYVSLSAGWKALLAITTLHARVCPRTPLFT